jgi:RND family efflux transporter MFP subunit
MLIEFDSLFSVRGVAATALTLFLGAVGSIARADTSPTVSVQTVPTKRGDLDNVVRAYGVIGGTSNAVMSISLPYPARVLRLRVTPGQRINAGDALFDVAPDSSALLASQQAASAVELARSEMERTKSLYEAHLATGTQLDTARKSLSDAQQGLSAQQRIGAARATETVKAPASATILEIQAVQGDQVAAGAPLMRLARADATPAEQANVTLSVEPGDVSRLHPGDTVRLRRLQADQASQTAQGRVVVVGAAIDPQSRLVNVAAAVPMPVEGWLPGMAVAADVVVERAAHWIVPRSAVLQDAQGAYLFQVDQGEKARRVAVDVQVESGDSYGVDGGLSASLPVVAVGNYELTDGMGVRSKDTGEGSKAE